MWFKCFHCNEEVRRKPTYRYGKTLVNHKCAVNNYKRKQIQVGTINKKCTFGHSDR
eukprot:UN00157